MVKKFNEETKLNLKYDENVLARYKNIIPFGGKKPYVVIPSCGRNDRVENDTKSWGIVNYRELARRLKNHYYIIQIGSNDQPTIEDADKIKATLFQLVRSNESNLTGNWRIGQLTEKNLTTQLKSIVVFEIPVDRLEGKFKMSQNREPEDAEGAAEGLRAIGDSNAKTVATEIEKRLRAR